MLGRGAWGVGRARANLLGCGVAVVVGGVGGAVFVVREERGEVVVGSEGGNESRAVPPRGSKPEI